jgi:hypothetical protein
MWEGEVLKAFLLCHRFDIVSITLGNCAKFRGSGGVWLKKGPTGGKKNFRFSAAGVNAQGLHPFLPACQQVKHTVSSTKLGCFGTENSILQLKKATLRHFWAKII